MSTSPARQARRPLLFQEGSNGLSLAVLCLSSTIVLILSLPDPEHSRLARLFLTSAYLAAAWLWWRAGARTLTLADSFLWRLGAILLLLLSINKLFSLRMLFESAMRAIAKSGNWYDSRQPVQFVFAVVLPLLLALIVTIFTLTKGKAFLSSRPAALAGWFFLLLYLALRQSQEWKPALAVLDPIHYRDWRMGLETLGIGMVIVSSLTSLRPRSRPA